jgi:hypothetical protein
VVEMRATNKGITLLMGLLLLIGSAFADYYQSITQLPSYQSAMQATETVGIDSAVNGANISAVLMAWIIPLFLIVIVLYILGRILGFIKP